MSTAVMRRVVDALAEIPPAAGWRDDVAAYARVLRSEYLLHRDGARIFSGTRFSDPEVVKAKEPWFERLTSADIDPARYALAGRDALAGRRRRTGQGRRTPPRRR